MSVSMEPELKAQFQHMEPYVMMDALKTHSIDQMKLEQFEQLDKFLSLQMEEHTCLETHLSKMYDVWKDLTDVYDYWMSDALAIAAVLRSLPPSYKEHARGYVVKGDSLTLLEFMSQFRTVKVEPIEGEIFDGTGILDILNYKCIIFRNS